MSVWFDTLAYDAFDPLPCLSPPGRLAGTQLRPRKPKSRCMDTDIVNMWERTKELLRCWPVVEYVWDSTGS